MFLKTNVTSNTGNIFYSDQVWKDCESACGSPDVPFLNRLSNVPIIGRIAGLVRIIFSALHIVGHLAASLFTRNIGHLCHVLKGFSEMLRGILEIIPVVGEIFSWCYNPAICAGHPSHACFNCTKWGNFFLIKIYNPEQPDQIDAMMNVSKFFPEAT